MVGEAAAFFLEEILSEHGLLEVPPAEADPHPQVERERAAYLQLHPRLREEHLGRYVAVYQGKVVDLDDDYGALFERIDDLYPDDFVWLTRIGKEPVGTIACRSPRLTGQDET